MYVVTLFSVCQLFIVTLVFLSEYYIDETPNYVENQEFKSKHIPNHENVTVKIRQFQISRFHTNPVRENILFFVLTL